MSEITKEEIRSIIEDYVEKMAVQFKAMLSDSMAASFANFENALLKRDQDISIKINQNWTNLTETKHDVRDCLGRITKLFSITDRHESDLADVKVLKVKCANCQIVEAEQQKTIKDINYNVTLIKGGLILLGSAVGLMRLFL